MEILNLAFYQFRSLDDLVHRRDELRALTAGLKLKGTVLLSDEGINGMICGTVTSVRRFQEVLRQDPVWGEFDYKETYSEGVNFARMLVKIKKEIIPIGDPEVRPADWTAPRLPARELQRWLDEGRDFTLLDTRNTYEISFGTFKGARHLDLRHFRHFGEKLRALPGDKSKPLVMFCTGGIRCEKASVVAARQGYSEVYQLDGGILRYFQECGSRHFDGECFVFDERVALDGELRASQTERARRYLRSEEG